MVPETNDTQSLLTEPPRSPLVVPHLLGMPAAIDLDDKGRVRTKEVDDIGSPRDLALPLPTAQLAVAEAGPAQGLGAGIGLTQFPGAIA